MMLAIEPVMVRLPASVEAIASASQPASRIGKADDERAQQHDRGHVAHQVRERGRDRHEDRDAMQVPRARSAAADSAVRPGALGAGDDDEQPDEEDQQAPVDLVVDRRWVRPSA